MSGSSILVIDIGTYSVRVMLLDQNAHCLFQARQSLQLKRLDENRVEQDAQVLLQHAQHLITKTTQQSSDIIAAALAIQRSTVVAWDQTTGKPLCPALSWQDTRTKNRLKALRKYADDISHRSGLVLSAHYGAGKLHWLREHLQTTDNHDTTLYGPLVTYVLHQLLDQQPFLIDESNAARTQLWNIKQRCWDTELCRLFDLPENTLPDCKPTMHAYGRLKDTNIPLQAVCGDQSAAFLGIGRLPADSVTINLGTGAFILAPNPKMIQHPMLLTSIANSSNAHIDYLMEATVNGAASALQWATQQWKIKDLDRQLPQWLSEINDPPVFLNTIGGLGSPWWQSGIEPRFTDDDDICTEKNPATAVVAIIESIVFMLAYNLTLIQKTLNTAINRCFVSGGLVKLDGLCEKLSSLADISVIRVTQQEATVLGAAYMTGKLKLFEPSVEKIFMPSKNPGLKNRYRHFCKCIAELNTQTTI